MNKILFMCFILIVLTMSISPITGQNRNSVVESTYQEVILEDFEQTVYTAKNIISKTLNNQSSAEAAILTFYLAPVLNSKKHLEIKINGKKGDVFKISPAKDLVINKYCRIIEVWAYGKNFSGELSIMLQDAGNKTHRLVLGKLNFLGWRKLQVTLTGKVNQQDEFLNQNKSMKILEFQYRPGNSDALPKWQYFYIDNISVLVREKYKDRQDDNW